MCQPEPVASTLSLLPMRDEYPNESVTISDSTVVSDPTGSRMGITKKSLP